MSDRKSCKTVCCKCSAIKFLSYFEKVEKGQQNDQALFTFDIFTENGQKVFQLQNFL